MGDQPTSQSAHRTLDVWILRHNHVAISHTTKETIMTKINEDRAEDLIDLGAASVETKGIGQNAPDASVGQLQFPTMGLCAD